MKEDILFGLKHVVLGERALVMRGLEGNLAALELFAALSKEEKEINKEISKNKPKVPSKAEETKYKEPPSLVGELDAYTEKIRGSTTVAGVCASRLDAAEVESKTPNSMKELAPVISSLCAAYLHPDRDMAGIIKDALNKNIMLSKEIKKQ